MTNQEHSNLKESLRLQYIAMTDYQERYLFWHEHQGNLQYVDSVKYSEPYSQAMKKKEQNDIELRQEQFNKGKKGAIIDTSGLWIEVGKINDLIEIEDETKGIKEPAPPTTDQDKAFVAKYWLDSSLKHRFKEDSRIFDYHNYKKAFLNEVSQKATPIEYAQKQIENFKKRIDEQIRNSTSNVIYPNGDNLTLKEFFEDLTNNKEDYQVDFTLLYECSKLYENGFGDLYFYGSYLIPFYQCKRFLESYIKKQENSKIEQNNSVASNLQPKAPIINTKVELITYAYFLEVINGTKRVYPFGRGKVEIEVYQDTIQDFGITHFEIIDKDSVPNDNVKKTILINRQKVTNKAMQSILEKVKTILLQKHLDKKDSIETAFNTYL
jgi:hypothetical protein